VEYKDEGERCGLEGDLGMRFYPSRGEENAIRAYIKEINKIPHLDGDELKALLLRKKFSDEDARERIIVSFLWLVVKLAAKQGRPDLDLLDIIQEGNIGLITAVDKYDAESTDKPFEKYAESWILKYIEAAIGDAQLIGVSDYGKRQARKVRIAEEKFLDKYGVMPSTAEIADLIGLSERQIKTAQEASPKFVVADRLLPEDSEELAESWADADVPTSDDIGRREARHAEVNSLLEELSESDREIITLWSENVPDTDIARVIGKSKGAARVALHRAIARAKAAQRAVGR